MVEIERLATARSWWLRASLRSAAMAWLLTAVAAWTPGAAAAPGKRRKPDPLVERYQHALGSGTLDDALGPLLAGSDTRAIGPELDALAAVLVAHKDRAAGAVELLSKRPHPAAPCAAAELLWRIALKKGLTDELASLAAGLLDHDDPFVRALAEWAIATRVEIDNKGQQIAWPRPQAPDWFRRWSALPADRLLEADYARMAVVWGIHYDGRKLLDSVGAIRRRARDAAGEALQSPDAGVRATVARQLQVLDAIQRRLAERVEAAPETTVAFRSAKERDFRGAKGDSAPDLTAQRKLWLAARRAARPIVLANPAIDFDELLLIKRHSAHSHRNITGSQYPWVHKPGGDICVQSGLEPGSPVRGVLGDRLGPGHVHGMDLWWDADRVVFAYARQPKWPPPWDTVRGNHVFLLRGNQEPTHLYEIRLDGSGLRQLTDDPYWSDLEPTYCADGGVVFASDRSGRSSECGRFSADHTVINIYRIDADAGKGVRDLSREAPEGPFRQKAPAAEKGSGTFCAKHPKGRSGKRSLTPFPLRRLSDNKDIDRYPHSLANGLIAYTRWEYQERHFFEVHSIWTVRPDGTMADAVFNQHLRAPFGFRDTRSVPGSPKLVSIATGHHTFAYGPVMLVDPRRGINAEEAIRVVTPYVRPQEGPMAGRAVAEGGVPDQGGLYQTPWALSETCFLASYSFARPPSGSSGGDNASAFAVYLIDAHGNKELIHRDLLLSCAFPMPLRPRPRPPVLPRVRAPEEKTATCFVSDVYGGMEGVRRGEVKHLRISQRVGWPLDQKIGAMRYIPGNAWERNFAYWAWAPVRVIGTVPVEEDGSACFKVPSDTALYFQALDADQRELRRMRSHISFQPGESRGCLGCHQTQLKTPSAGRTAPLALGREPTLPVPPPWGAKKLLGYEWLVQPILQRRCVRCHGAEKPDGGLDLSATPTEDGIYRSYRTLFGLRSGTDKPGPALVSVSNRFDGAAVTRPRQFGSHQSRLITVLLADELHRKEAKLSPDEWTALVTWVDANAPYYDTFFNRRPADGGPPRRDVHIELPAPFAGLTTGGKTAARFVTGKPQDKE